LRGGKDKGGVPDAVTAKGEFVRWSSSTEIGDFVRDAAREKVFKIEIEGYGEISVGVPSFKERTYYLRQRLLATTKELANQKIVKDGCDREARKGAQRVAVSGFVVLAFWWMGVYYVTYKTSLGVCFSFFIYIFYSLWKSLISHSGPWWIR
jgi:calcium uniporter protein, mitochondrial